MKSGRADQRTAGTKPWRCKTAKFLSWTLSGVQGGGGGGPGERRP